MTFAHEGFYGGVDALLSQLDAFKAQLQKSDKTMSDLISRMRELSRSSNDQRFLNAQPELKKALDLYDKAATPLAKLIDRH